MKLSEFLNFNRICPLCQEPLGLYMQWVDSMCFKASLVEDNLYQFDPFIGNSKDIEADERLDHYMLLQDNQNSIDVQFSTPKLTNLSKKYQIYFFYLCNPAGIKKLTWGDYEINLFKGCYYRSTPLMEFQRSKDQELKNWELKITNPGNSDIINKDEAFTFRATGKDADDKDIHKVYMLNLNSEEKITNLWYYTYTEEDMKDKHWRPKSFATDVEHKGLPLIKSRPDLSLENRDKLLARFDNWILMS